MTDRPLARRLGDALRRTVEREYAAEVVCAAWESLFQELAGAEAPALEAAAG